MKLAYLMYIAKRDEGSACGGYTDAIVITDNGQFVFVDHGEMEEAEKIARDVDEHLNKAASALLGDDGEKYQDHFLKKWVEHHKELRKQIGSVKFESLKRLDRAYLEK